MECTDKQSVAVVPCVPASLPPLHDRCHACDTADVNKAATLAVARLFPAPGLPLFCVQPAYALLRSWDCTIPGLGVSSVGVATGDGACLLAPAICGGSQRGFPAGQHNTQVAMLPCDGQGQQVVYACKAAGGACCCMCQAFTASQQLLPAVLAMSCKCGALRQGGPGRPEAVMPLPVCRHPEHAVTHKHAVWAACPSQGCHGMAALSRRWALAQPKPQHAGQAPMHGAALGLLGRCCVATAHAVLAQTVVTANPDSHTLPRAWMQACSCTRQVQGHDCCDIMHGGPDLTWAPDAAVSSRQVCGVY